MQSLRTIVFLGAALGLPLTASPLAFAGNDIKLSGTIALDAETCAKGTSGPDCTLNFLISGGAAKAIYDGMTAKGEMQECTGNVEKFDESGMHCIKGKSAKDYSCDFSYAFVKHTFGAGPDGC